VIPDAQYTGFDYLPGPNVDVVGDIHRLSDYFEPESFDLIFSFAVFEHLAAPWVAAEEISKVLAVGGHVSLETHFSYSEHELPWHFFQFNSTALEVLFCEELGFTVVDSGLDSPIVGRFSHFAPKYLRGSAVRELYCHSSIIARKETGGHWAQSSEPFDWRQVTHRVAGGSSYPRPTGT
jgi:SAM-dependent methyltransferase